MTEAQFHSWPFLLLMRQVLDASGYSPATLRKMVDCGLLREVRIAGTEHRRFLKLQVSKIVGVSIGRDLERFNLEPLLMSEKSTIGWTGFCARTLGRITVAGGLHSVQPAGLDTARYLKSEIGLLLGFTHFL